ncbi:DUF7684 family protein [Massilia phyllosphaerae]|uniref:DUF7684 family protein n=1 Tax=Massilia phyllosphaerae TaxID=3106034 RepID=UPI002B1CD0A1|nr:hypothetical protein [Massilia sp. SGZ-792]
MQKTVNYLHLLPDGSLPHMMDKTPFMAILIADEDVSQMWLWDTSRWLVEAGCRVLLAWGKDAEVWSEAVDDAAAEALDAATPEDADDQAVVTTSHEDDDLEELFWFARHRAAHPVLTLNRTLIVHVAAGPRREELEAAWAAA